MKRRRLRTSVRLFFRRLKGLFLSPIFLGLTLFGNLVVLTSAVALYVLERGQNPHIQSLLDTIWWAVSTVTTVGYGDVSPVTSGGRIIGIFTMIVGTALFWSYTAVFADALLNDEITDLEDELRSIEKRLRQLSLNEASQNQEVHLLVQKLRHTLSRQEMKNSNEGEVS